MKIDGLKWVCLCVPPQKEYLAEGILRQTRVAVNAFVPTEMKMPRRARRRKEVPAPIPYPLLGARYVLAGWEGPPPLFDLWRTGIVSGVVGINGKPAQIKTEAVKVLANQSEYAYPSSVAPTGHQAFTLGQAVVVSSDHPFAGHTSKIVSFRDNLATILVQFLCSPHVIELRLDQIEAA